MALLDRTLIVDGVRLACGDRGHGPPVVLIHGTPAHSFIWRNVAPAVEAAGFRVIVYDLLGYGASERPVFRDTAVPAQTELLCALLDELAIDRCAVVGHDIGGAIAQRLAVHHAQRVTRQVLVDTVSYDSWPSETWQAIIRDQLDRYAAMPADEFEAMLTRQLEMTVADPQHMTGEVLESYLAPHHGRLGRVSFFEHQVRTYDSAATEEIAPALRDLSVPTKIIWGAADRWQPLDYAHRLAGDIPGAQLAVVDEAGHFVTEDAPHQVTEELTRFLGHATLDGP